MGGSAGCLPRRVQELPPSSQSQSPAGTGKARAIPRIIGRLGRLVLHTVHLRHLKDLNTTDKETGFESLDGV